MAPGTVVLGKRKRRVPADKAADADAKAEKAAAMEEAQAIFRKHFEAQFAPLGGSGDEASRPAAKDRRKASAGMEADGGDGAAGVEDMRSETSDSGEDEDGQDEWDGLSAEEDDDEDEGSEDGEGNDDSSEGDETSAGSETEETNTQVEVVDYSKPTPSLSTLTPQTALMTKREMRAYLSSRPPDAVSSAEGGKGKQAARAKHQRQGGGNNDEDPQNEDSRSLLASDLELQRLISESHILSATNPFNTAASGASHASKAFSEGRTRALTTDLRLQKLGSKDSIFKQQKMPMAMRKGILGARASREDKRRREAKENGIILERPEEGGSSGSSKKARRHKGKGSDLPVDMPGMGRMKGGELRLNKRDVRAVEREGKRMTDSRGKGKHRKRR
ncbi:hypothetical protein J7T55_009248 [Diaporthe amygdali]|uniref:uncharacterized protein n=1 Tax=Phomopsis amygdali TaxID=1214568 RepID=UPI0022FDB21D|nr:uncharacterized protein J7T55_009248 [Diaporthe amygdali]KAJ0118465.1 hypothetical protein J7T55_009248 [Diaporthe amygdali]